MTRFLAAAALLLAGCCHALPLELETVSRLSEVDVNKKFTLAYTFAGGCPQRVAISNTKVNSQGIISVPHSDIVENGKQCEAGRNMRVVRSSRMTKQQLLDLGFPIAARTITSNKNAAAVLAKNNGKEMLVGFDEGERRCNDIVYPAGTFWFFIRQPTSLAIDVNQNDKKDPTKIAKTAIEIPGDKRTLLIAGPGDKLCLVEDGTTVPGKGVKINGKASPSPSPSKKPAKKEPKQVNPVPKPPQASPTAAPPSPVVTPSVAPIEELPSPAPEESPASDGSVCFPASASVELESGERVSMADLRIGDRVRTGPSSFSDVFLFTHRDADVHARFVRLVTAAGSSVTLTKSHYLYANGALVSAGSVRNGDVLQLADGSSSPVSAIENVSADGLYNPQTVDGNIVVDGIVSSAYTTAVHPRVAHSALLMPLRFLYERSRMSIAVLDALASFISSDTDSLGRVVPAGPAMLTA